MTDIDPLVQTPPVQTPLVQPAARPHTRTPWEVQILSGCIAAATAVITVCLCIFTVAALLFGLAELKAHWP